MKNTFYLCLIASLFFACQAPGETEAEAGPTNIEIVEQLYAYFAEGNVEAVLAGMTEDVVWNEAESFLYAGGNPYIGPQAVLDGVFSPILADFDNFRLEGISLSSVDDDGVLGMGRYKGTFKANGMDLDAQFAHVFRLKEGKVASFQQFTDTKKAYDISTAEAVEEVETIEEQ